jgi:hypothetical protein
MSNATDTQTTPDVPPEARRLPRTGEYAGRVRIVLIVIFAVGTMYRGLTNYFRFEAWSERRAAWHQRCDFPRQQTFATLTAYAVSRDWCQHELDALTAEARRNGWGPPEPAAAASPAAPAR